MIRSKALTWISLFWLLTGIGALITALVLWAMGFQWPADPAVYNFRDIYRNIAGVLVLYGVFTTPAAFFVLLAPLGKLNKKEP